MKWALVAFAATACLQGACAQPASCRTDDQCQSGFYCDRDAFVCRACLDCEQLKREPPLLPTGAHCIKSVAECGSCIEGLVDDLKGELNLQCVPRDARDGAMPAYVWAIVSIGLLLFAAGIGIVIYLLKHTKDFKILATTDTSVQPCSVGTGVGARLGAAPASAPDAPPPYNAHYLAARPSSPPHSPEPHQQPDDARHAEEWPFIKRTPSGHERGASGGARESADSQAARIFNSPHYVRGATLPPSYDGAVGMDVEPAASADMDSERDAFAHDEDTALSTWRPTAEANGNAATGAVDGLSAQLEAARGTNLITTPHPPHAPHPPHPPHPPPSCGWQDANNNGGEALGAGGASGAGPSGAPAFIINVVQTINAQAPPHRDRDHRDHC